ncbi:MAG: PSD1 and planctomycete cytochrome C domain-containing protein, partial [Pirellula sp.]
DPTRTTSPLDSGMQDELQSVIQATMQQATDSPRYRRYLLGNIAVDFLPGRSIAGSVSFVAKMSIIVVFGIACWPSLLADATDREISFDRDVRPILSEKCFHCHGPDAKTRQADLRLDDAAELARVTTRNDGVASPLEHRISTTADDQRMPPPQSKKELTRIEQSIIAKWIENGAHHESHWSFVPPRKHKLPVVADASLVENEIDLFIVSKLEQESMSISSRAGIETLLRRASLDLTGLPPTPEEVAIALSDRSHDAYERIVDRLLSSPRYGQHMASFWLDASRYADTDGYQNDRFRYQHVWRDWVIMALNQGKPYDQFVIEQLAGDLLPNASLKQQIATGFCRNHRINSEDGSIPDEWQVEYVADRVDTVGTVLLGLTVGCARCHDHKYDPITQKEYYQLFAFFNNVPEWGVGPNNGNSPPFIEVPKSWPNLSADEDQRLVPEPVELHPARKEAGNGLKRPQAGSESTVMIMHEMDEPRPTYLLVRGRYDVPDKSAKLSPGVPASLSAGSGPKPLNSRLDLASWLVDPQNPLTARVAVNRFWQQFFGTGLVKTSENLGTQGERPSHPELLDWLALEFVNSSWDIKRLQKKILMSSTYRQLSAVSPDSLERDHDNRWLSRGPRFRLPAFVIRDQALLMSGMLVEQVGGPPVKPYMPADLWSSISNNKYEQGKGSDLFRRSLYTYWRRTIPPPTMMSFDSATREVCAVRTDRTNTPLQALTLLNNVAFVEASKKLAERIIKEIPSSNDVARLRLAFIQVVGREPSKAEFALLELAMQSFRSRFQSDIQAAKKLLTSGEYPSDTLLDPIEHAALTMVASLLLNLDETITKE